MVEVYAPRGALFSVVAIDEHGEPRQEVLESGIIEDMVAGIRYHRHDGRVFWMTPEDGQIWTAADDFSEGSER